MEEGGDPLVPPSHKVSKIRPMSLSSFPSLFSLKNPRAESWKTLRMQLEKVQLKEFSFSLSSADVEKIRGMMVRLRLFFSVCLRNAERKVSSCSEGGRVN